jgi:hypothetical protein
MIALGATIINYSSAAAMLRSSYAAVVTELRRSPDRTRQCAGRGYFRRFALSHPSGIPKRYMRASFAKRNTVPAPPPTLT